MSILLFFLKIVTRAQTQNRNGNTAAGKRNLRIICRPVCNADSFGNAKRILERELAENTKSHAIKNLGIRILYETTGATDCAKFLQRQDEGGKWHDYEITKIYDGETEILPKKEEIEEFVKKATQINLEQQDLQANSQISKITNISHISVAGNAVNKRFLLTLGNVNFENSQRNPAPILDQKEEELKLLALFYKDFPGPNDIKNKEGQDFILKYDDKFKIFHLKTHDQEFFFRIADVDGEKKYFTLNLTQEAQGKTFEQVICHIEEKEKTERHKYLKNQRQSYPDQKVSDQLDFFNDNFYKNHVEGSFFTENAICDEGLKMDAINNCLSQRHTQQVKLPLAYIEQRRMGFNNPGPLNSPTAKSPTFKRGDNIGAIFAEDPDDNENYVGIKFKKRKGFRFAKATKPRFVIGNRPALRITENTEDLRYPIIKNKRIRKHVKSESAEREVRDKLFTIHQSNNQQIQKAIALYKDNDVFVKELREDPIVEIHSKRELGKPKQEQFAIEIPAKNVGNARLEKILFLKNGRIYRTEYQGNPPQAKYIPILEQEYSEILPRISSQLQKDRLAITSAIESSKILMQRYTGERTFEKAAENIMESQGAPDKKLQFRGGNFQMATQIDENGKFVVSQKRRIFGDTVRLDEHDCCSKQQIDQDLYSDPDFLVKDLGQTLLAQNRLNLIALKKIIEKEKESLQKKGYEITKIGNKISFSSPQNGGDNFTINLDNHSIATKGQAEVNEAGLVLYHNELSKCWIMIQQARNSEYETPKPPQLQDPDPGPPPPSHRRLLVDPIVPLYYKKGIIKDETNLDNEPTGAIENNAIMKKIDDNEKEITNLNGIYSAKEVAFNKIQSSLQPHQRLARPKDPQYVNGQKNYINDESNLKANNALNAIKERLREELNYFNYCKKVLRPDPNDTKGAALKEVTDYAARGALTKASQIKEAKLNGGYDLKIVTGEPKFNGQLKKQCNWNQRIYNTIYRDVDLTGNTWNATFVNCYFGAGCKMSTEDLRTLNPRQFRDCKFSHEFVEALDAKQREIFDKKFGSLLPLQYYFDKYEDGDLIPVDQIKDLYQNKTDLATQRTARSFSNPGSQINPVEQYRVMQNAEIKTPY